MPTCPIQSGGHLGRTRVASHRACLIRSVEECPTVQSDGAKARPLWRRTPAFPGMESSIEKRGAPAPTFCLHPEPTSSSVDGVASCTAGGKKSGPLNGNNVQGT